VTTYSKYSPLTNTCVHKSVSSHISLCTPCIYVLAWILHTFLGISGYSSVRHRMASDIGTAILLRMDPKLDRQQASSLTLCCQVDKHVCWKHKWCKMWVSQHSVTKQSTVPECNAVSLGKKPSEASQCFYHQAQTFFLGLFNLWRWRHYDPLQCSELLTCWQCQIPEYLNHQQWTQQWL
jgi:hypothetical protein